MMIVSNFAGDKFPPFFMENNSLRRLYASRPTSSDMLHDQSKLDAVECFTRSLSFIPGGWLEECLRARGEPFAIPICHGLFLVDEPSVANRIKRHFCDDVFNEDDDRLRLIESGWNSIRSTGLFGREIDGFVVLGIDGLGYDFFEAHWEPLYDLLGYKWHLNVD